MSDPRKLYAFLIMISVLGLAFVPPRSSAASDIGGRKEMWVKLNVFNPCEVQVDFEYTSNVSVSDVTAYGPSLYEVTQSPIQIRFEAQDVDEYLFHVTLKYPVVTVQTIRVTWFSGENRPPSSMDIPITAQEAVIHFSIETATEPHYPTTTEITENVMRQVNERLELYHSDNLEMQEIMKEGINNNLYLAGAIGLGLILMAVVFWKTFKPKELDRPRRRELQ